MYIFCSAGPASHRRCQLSSNVRHHNFTPPRSMTTTELQPCLLCGTAAEYMLGTHNQWKTFSCPSCRQYIVATEAEERLLTARQDWKDRCSKMAQSARDDKILSRPCKIDFTQCRANRTTPSVQLLSRAISANARMAGSRFV